MKEITADDILETLERYAREKLPVSPDRYLDAAMALNSLQGNEDDLFYMMEHHLAELRASYVEQGMTSAKAKILVEKTPEFLEARRQKAKIARIVETIRLAKQRARMASEEMRNQ